MGKRSRCTKRNALGYYAALQETITDIKQLIKEDQISP